MAEEPKKSHKLRNLLIVLGLAGLAAFVYKKVTGKDADPAWTQSRDSLPPGRPTRPPLRSTVGHRTDRTPGIGGDRRVTDAHDARQAAQAEGRVNDRTTRRSIQNDRNGTVPASITPTIFDSVHPAFTPSMAVEIR